MSRADKYEKIERIGEGKHELVIVDAVQQPSIFIFQARTERSTEHAVY